MTPRLHILRGDLTTEAADAIVNAANQKMLGGGGVDGAIHRAAGPGLLEACRTVPEVRSGVRCPTGEARITSGFDLPARYVVHTVGPIYRGASGDALLLASAFRSSIELAIEHGVRTLAFPAISCGVYGYPIRDAARISAQVVRERAWDLDEIRFVLFSQDVFTAWTAAFA
ncbi:MAG: O-acetyl-ADP-ribose deacetylase [Deltaproteobacteria bacterium]|nr:O-acetyl-ADP-ribose deacetylase [Deltaproteobacteria bacterium]MBW2214346.1 O-acetyl-ADP-ribose deacetylase [Deltaproteobacteria bacterium]MBW2378429.1 O-acetyl-ADP-ribose deacetylase [Deltaproteobacteria bacterium]MBW2551489.1 O-acetyl-ADP-ribose deacetylase [Deltaproteobacteria bacterium]MBW2627162.1 O-acetyl-ADP-ribose deacetylase [Deltaproteobacteria bacterium]